MPDPRAMTEMALNTATMVAFAIPGGEVVAPVFAIAELLVGLFWQDRPIPPEERPVTVAAFNDAMADLKDAIRQTLQDAKLQDHTNLILALTKTFHANWAEALKLKTVSDNFTGDFNYALIDDDTTRAFVESMDKYFQTSAGTLTLSGSILNSVKIDGQSSNALALQNQTFRLFILVGTLRVSYLKAAVAWRWCNEILAVRRWKQWLKADAQWKKNPDLAHPELAPVQPEKSISSVPEWQDWVNEAGCPVDDLRREVQNLLNYAEDQPASSTHGASKGVYTTLAKNWAARVPNLTDRLNKITVTGSFSVSDAQTNKVIGPFPSQLQADKALEVVKGVQIASVWEYWTQQGKLDSIADGEVEAFGKAIQEWKLIRDSVNFQTYKWQDTDTVDNLVSTFYSTDKRADRIMDANRLTIPANRTVTAGMVLTIPNLDGSLAPTTYTVKASETLTAIASAMYPDAALHDWICTVNKDKLIPGTTSTFQANAVLKFPDLGIAIPKGGGNR